MTATPHVLTPIVDRPEQRVWIASALAAVLLALPISQLPVPPVGVTELLLGLCLAASVAASERWASTTVRIGEQTHNLTLGEVPLVVGLVIAWGSGLLEEGGHHHHHHAPASSGDVTGPSLPSP